MVGDTLKLAACIRRFRSRGHLVSQLDPLGRTSGGPWLGPVGGGYSRCGGVWMEWSAVGWLVGGLAGAVVVCVVGCQASQTSEPCAKQLVTVELHSGCVVHLPLLPYPMLPPPDTGVTAPCCAWSRTTRGMHPLQSAAGSSHRSWGWRGTLGQTGCSLWASSCHVSHLQYQHRVSLPAVTSAPDTLLLIA